MGTRTYQVALATIEIGGLFNVDPQTLGSSWVPGTMSKRYGRDWRLSKALITDEGWLGRLGFVKPGEVTTLSWDDAKQDFLETDAAGGVVVPFLIDLRRSVVAYQLRAGLVRPNTFTGALESVLNLEGTYSWSVSPLVKPRSFEAWQQDVDRIVSFTFRLEQPNPNWLDRELVEGLVTKLEAEYVRLGARAPDGGSVDATSDLFRQALDHVLQGYGSGRVEGADQAGQRVEWKATAELGGVVPAVTRVEAESDAVEVPADTLPAALEELADRMGEAAHPDVSDDEDDAP